MTDSTQPAGSTGDRMVSLDQFRGYTVAGMFLVNFVGGYAAIAAFLPSLKHWHTYCSYADTIMPQFLFAVGFGFRLSYLKRRSQIGATVANWRIVHRILGLLLVAVIIHHLDGHYQTWDQVRQLGIGGFFRTAFQREFFQTLAHIAMTSLWVVPVVGASWRVRVAYLLFSCGLFVLLSSSWYYDWELTRPGIDGGPLGFLTWSAPLLLGTLAYDICQLVRVRTVETMGVLGLLVMLVGYGLSCISLTAYPNLMPSSASWVDRLAEPPFVRPIEPGSARDWDGAKLNWFDRLTVAGNDIPSPAGRPIGSWVESRNQAFQSLPASDGLTSNSRPQELSPDMWLQPGKRYLNQWTMSQRAGSPAYTIFGGGFSLVIMSLAILLCDRWGWQLGLFRTLGVNALFGYILHDLVNSALKPFVPKDAPLWYVLTGFGLSLAICYLILRTLEKQRIIFRL